MKKSKTKILSIILIATLVLSMFLTGTTFATEAEPTLAEETQGEELPLTTEATGDDELNLEGNDAELEGYDNASFNIDPESIYEGDLYVFFGENDIVDTNYEKDYVMDKYVDGNAFIFGNNVKIEGLISGSLFVFASQTLTIDESAIITGNVFAFSQDMKMYGSTSNMYAVATNFETNSNTYIDKDLKLFANNATLKGTIGRDVDLSGNNIVLDSEDKLNVGRDFNYTSDKEIENINDMNIDGNVNYTREEMSESGNKNVIGDFIYGAVENILFTFIIYVLLIFLAPKFIEKSKEYVSTRGLLAAAIGLGFTICVPIVALIVLITIIGIPLSIAIALAYIIVLMIGSAVTTIVANEYITDKVEALKETWKKVLMIIPVAFVVYLIRQIPVLGGLVSAIFFLVGVGVVVLYQFDKRVKKEE